MCRVPVGSVAQVHLQGNLQRGRSGHHPRDFLAEFFGVFLRALEHQFVVHLHDQPHLVATRLQPFVDADHGQLDDVRGRSLHRRVYGAAFGVTAAAVVAGADIRKIQTPAEQRFHPALIVGQPAGVFHVFLDAGIAGEVVVYVFLRFGAAYAELPRESERGHSIDEPEINRLGGPPLVGAD